MTRRSFLLAAASPISEGVSDYFRLGVEKHGIVGASLSPWHKGRMIVEERFGYQNLEKKQPVSPSTLYHWVSVTKTLTSIAILQLRDLGLLTVDDPITKYCPEIVAARNRFGSMDEITIRRVLSHSSGFRAATWPWPAPRDQTSPTAWQ